MYDTLLKQLQVKNDPVEVIVVGLGFVSFGFISSIRNLRGMRVPLIISRRPEEAKAFLEKKGFKVKIEENPDRIKDLAKKGYISVSDNLDLIEKYDNKIVIEMTGTVAYGTEAALRALKTGKNLVTMNPELQATVGTELKEIADKKNLIITDVLGDQPGCISRLICHAKMMGFKPLIAGNMKRYLDKHATQKKMKPWADNKGLSVRQTISFTDGTKQAIEMNLVANYFGMSILKSGMKGPRIDDIRESLKAFENEPLPERGIVDYVIGLKLFPGVFIIAEHKDPEQYKYLRYLNMGEGPRYVLFDAYHLCHLEVAATIAKVALLKQETINNGLKPTTKTVAVAKFNLEKGQKLDGIGGDFVYGSIYSLNKSQEFLPVGLTDGALVKHNIPQDQPIKISDVSLPVNAAAKLAGLI